MRLFCFGTAVLVGRMRGATGRHGDISPPEFGANRCGEFDGSVACSMDDESAARGFRKCAQLSQEPVNQAPAIRPLGLKAGDENRRQRPPTPRALTGERILQSSDAVEHRPGCRMVAPVRREIAMSLELEALIYSR